MKKYIYITAVCIAALASCRGYLDENNLTKYSIDYIYTTPEGLKLAVNALYDKDRNLMSFQDYKAL